MNQLLLRRFRIWRRSPAFFAQRVLGKVLQPDESWVSKSRESFLIGSWQWLALTEMLYGGFKVGVASKENRGGDRMSPLYHGYGFTYEEFLKHFTLRQDKHLTILEVGILNGSGLAIWCDLFPRARVIGLDIDLANYKKNLAYLNSVGAFSLNQPEIYEFDQLDLDKAKHDIGEIVGSDKLDIVIDDGCHSIESIRNTLAVAYPHLSDKFAYFVEDNFDTYDELACSFKHIRWHQRGEMTIATRGL